MRLGSAGLLIALFALAGCKGLFSPKSADKKDKDKDKDKDAAVVSRPKGALPAWLGEGSNAAVSGNAARESQGLLAGRVLDPSGRGADGVFIRIDPVDALPEEKEGAPRGILTNSAGEFLARGLVTGRVYALTAEQKSRSGERPLVGMAQTRPPQANITIVLRDDTKLPGPAVADGSLPPGASTTSLPPGSDRIPGMGLSAPAPSGGVGAGEWVPGAGSTSGPIRATIPGAAPPPSGGLPPPAGLFPPAEPPPPVRPDTTASGDAPWKPPTVSIPGGPPVQSLPLPPPGAPASPGVPPPEKRSAAPRPNPNITLVDSLERPWSFARNRSGSLVLLEFMTTNCTYCVKAIPDPMSLQARYESSGLQLIGVLCDNLPRRERATQAAKYQRDHNLNYAVYVEPGAEAGAIRDHFGIQAYPTVVLLDGRGAVIWQGHPGKKAELESAIRRQLGK